MFINIFINVFLSKQRIHFLHQCLANTLLLGKVKYNAFPTYDRKGQCLMEFAKQNASKMQFVMTVTHPVDLLIVGRRHFEELDKSRFQVNLNKLTCKQI